MEFCMRHIFSCVFTLVFIILCSSAPNSAAAAGSAVIVQYHRFGENSHPSTNIRIQQFEAHVAELVKPEYTVLPLPEIIARIKDKKALPEKTVAITIDDAFVSVYTEAFPRLREARLPFTLFVATQPVDRSINGYMSWEQIRELQSAGITIGSQTHTHLHMAKADPDKNRSEILISNKLFKKELGIVPKIIAYPYGEYSLAVGQTAMQAGFETGFGQHSGVIHAEANMMYLPRFSMNENYGGLSRFRLAINALPLDITDLSPLDPLLSKQNNPPALGFTVKGIAATRLQKLACYTPTEGKVRLERIGARVEVRFKTAFPAGRARINCTIRTRAGRWRWYGLQFYIPQK